MGGSSRRGSRALGWAIEALALALPLRTATRLGRASESSAEAVLGSEILVDLLMIWSLLLAAVLGFLGSWFVSSARASDPLAGVRASTWRMLVVLLVAGASLGLVEPPDFMRWDGAWRRLGTFLAIGPVPLWACASLLRSRGVGLLPAAGVCLAVGAVAVGGTWLVGKALFLHQQAALAPLAAVGVVSSVGLALSTWERVPGRWQALVPAIAGLGMAVAGAMSFFLTRAPLETGWVDEVIEVDRRTGRAVVVISQGNTRPRLFSVDRTPVAVTPLHPRTERVTESADGWVELRRSWRSTLFGGEGAFAVCVGRGAEEVCVDHLVRGNSPLFAGHPRRERVVVFGGEEILAWDLDTDRVWLLRREGAIRWPCQTEAGDLIWRMQTESGPYRHETFAFPADAAGTVSRPGDASGSVEELPLDHDLQCVAGSLAEPTGNFRRGRRRLGRLSKLTGPGLPEDGIHVDGSVGTVRWSDDGKTAAIVTDGNQSVRFYNEAWGLRPALPIPGIQGPELSGDGRWMARPVELGGGVTGFEVRTVPDGEARFRVPAIGPPRFDGLGGILQVWEGNLATIDVESGEATPLFPR